MIPRPASMGLRPTSQAHEEQDDRGQDVGPGPDTTGGHRESNDRRVERADEQLHPDHNPHSANTSPPHEAPFAWFTR